MRIPNLLKPKGKRPPPPPAADPAPPTFTRRGSPLCLIEQALAALEAASSKNAALEAAPSKNAALEAASAENAALEAASAENAAFDAAPFQNAAFEAAAAESASLRGAAVEEATLQGDARSPSVVLLIVDLDRFKLINDLCGPAAGDLLIDIMHQRLTGIVDHAQIIHLGADEFACLLTDSPSQDVADRLAAILLAAIADPVSLGRHMVHPTASIGIAGSISGAGVAEELLRAASIALSHAKLAGGGRIRRFSPEMFSSLAERATLEDDLRGGLLRGELVPYYQPIVALPSGEVLRFEALARWHHPQRGTLGPDRFLSIAEDVGLNDDLLYAMARQSCRDARSWPERIGLSLNMSPRQICAPDVVAQLMRIVFASGLGPERLTIEITEDAVIHNVGAAQAMVATLRNFGVGIALDDFGTGYASLSRICKLPLDMIKIDRTLVQSLDDDAGRKLVKVVMDLGQSLSMPVTAEGIESEKQARDLTALGCAFGQGYLFGRPVSAAETAQLLASGTPVTIGC